jgi:hypothetical protein
MLTVVKGCIETYIRKLYYDGSIKICVLLCWLVGFRVMAKWDTIVFRIVLVLGS